jgi:hypothetical protein
VPGEINKIFQGACPDLPTVGKMMQHRNIKDNQILRKRKDDSSSGPKYTTTKMTILRFFFK